MFGKEQVAGVLNVIDESCDEFDKLIDIIERNTIIVPFDVDCMMNSENKFIETILKEKKSLKQIYNDFLNVEDIEEFRYCAICANNSIYSMIRYKRILEEHYFVKLE